MPPNINPKVKGTTKVSISGITVHAQSKHCHRNNVLAERNQAVAPVGAWVESGQDCQDEHPNVRAMLTEELQMEIQREKEESLRRFQEEAEQEERVLQQSSDAAQRLTPRKNPFPYSPQRELAICSPNSRWVRAQGHESSDRENRTDLQTHQLSKVMRQVRHRLAACQTIRDGEVMSELPGGIWKVSPTRDKHVYRVTREEEDHEKEEEDIPLIGQHDSALQNFDPHEGYRSKTVTFDNNPVCQRLFSEPYPAGHSNEFSTDHRAAQVLWPQEDQEELKRQGQSQFLMYRRLFMDIEREQVKEHQRHRKHLRRIGRIKAEKEQKRLEEERKLERLRQLEEDRLEMAEREFLILERLRLEEEERAEVLEKKERAKKDKEATRYIEALRAQMKERIVLENTELPPLCCCGDSFWDSHPDTCANNCVFYNNPKAYVQALRSALLSCDLKDRSHSTHQRASARRIASLHALSPRKETTSQRNKRKEDI
ncbi:coiled-coil domain-containing protein 15 isoform X2 [Salvelinus sp. IW2-2015]|uniref:coiled-coil domain-containing protein 15 isoform X2 n=1 Tax=Salvelinus sp. IW2-2015 TaxID=2691554 RepID=UPI000CDF93AE|nr:coiled-coil domain-containing protein 15 isoform X2 [Salvelinus alpinus]